MADPLVVIDRECWDPDGHRCVEPAEDCDTWPAEDLAFLADTCPFPVRFCSIRRDLLPEPPAPSPLGSFPDDF